MNTPMSISQYRIRLVTFFIVFIGLFALLPVVEAEITLEALYRESIKVPGDFATLNEAIANSKRGDTIWINDSSAIDYPITVTQEELTFYCASGVAFSYPSNKVAFEFHVQQRPRHACSNETPVGTTWTMIFEVGREE